MKILILARRLARNLPVFFTCDLKKYQLYIANGRRMYWVGDNRSYMHNIRSEIDSDPGNRS